ncbi:extensin [Iris pallida]|uniref:Extensin n=1 Tax=Iris pallida TaxID=29817 RepID=A0AAX6HHQ9_IRIPA|nr:extensin [Iris pallida]KAJ6840157.1 extensin [Iris pallida]
MDCYGLFWSTIRYLDIGLVLGLMLDIMICGDYLGLLLWNLDCDLSVSTRSCRTRRLQIPVANLENWCTTYYNTPEADHGLDGDAGDDIVDVPLEDS